MKLLIGDKEASKYLGLEGDILYIVTLDSDENEVSRIKVGTIADVASDSSDGLMSSEDKTKLDNLSNSVQVTKDSDGDTSTSIEDSTTISSDKTSTSYDDKDTGISSNQSLTNEELLTEIKTLIGKYYLQSSTEQKTDSIVNSITLTGGSNLILNSSFINGMTNWVTSAGSPTISNFSIISGTSSKVALHSDYGSRDKVLQEIDLKGNTRYYLSLSLHVLKVGTEFNWSGISIYQNDNLITNLGQAAINDDFVTYKSAFTLSSDGSVRLEVFSDADSECYISSLMINTIDTDWETNPNDNSYTTLTLDKTGLSMTDNQGELKLSNTGISRNSKINDQTISVFDINDTLSMIRNLNVLNDLLLGDVKMIPVSGDNAEGLAFL